MLRRSGLSIAPRFRWECLTSYARALERTNLYYIPRRRLVGNLNYELPFGPGKQLFSGLQGVPKLLIGGWNLTAELMTDSGLYFNPTFSGYDVSNTNTIGGRPDRMADGNLPKSQRSVNHWFDASAFAVPGDVTGDGKPDVAVGRFGNSAPNCLVGPPFFILSSGLFKRIRIKERASVVLQGTFQNVTNTPSYDLPSANISAPASVGRILGLRQKLGTARNGMVGMRIEF